jgi:ribosomal protein S18 acetylase RimI-like enzyme/8-oxo-dGTP pyrophosphatase MutT (NUDIX family)
MITIRPALTADADDIWRIFQPIAAAGDSYTFAAETTRADAEAYFLGPGMPAFVALDHGRVVGFYKLIPNHRDRGAHVANASFMVDPACSGRGIGRALGHHCLQEARDRGYVAMQFNFVVSTNTRAVALWQSLGFAVIATLPGAFRHRTLGDVDALVMFRRLDDFAPSEPEPPPVFGERTPGQVYEPRPSAYAVIPDADGRIAIVETAEGVFLPGGGIDAGEWADLAAVREAREECAVEIRTTWLVGQATDLVSSARKGQAFEKPSIFLAAELLRHAAAPGEHVVAWLAPEHAERRITRGGHRWALSRWHARRESNGARDAR